jgi:hypothetical protein
MPPASDEADEQAAELAARQTLGQTPLIDLCRFRAAAANTVHVVVVADVIFHWDMKGSYIMPTTQLSWARDVQQLLKAYPRTTEVHLYTAWNSEKLTDGKRTIIHHPVADVPMETEAWINMPSFQEKYGTPLLAAGIAAAVIAFGITWWQGRTIDGLTTQIRAAESELSEKVNVGEITRLLTDQEGQMKYRDAFAFIAKDITNAIARADMRAENFELRNVNPQEIPKQLVATITAQKDAYRGWLQEEPIAKQLLINSATFSAIRKQPGNQLKLEGLIELEKTAKELAAFTRATGATTPTTPEVNAPEAALPNDTLTTAGATP